MAASVKPRVELGETRSDGIAPSMFAMLERGVGRNPSLAAELRGTVAIRFDEEIAPLRITMDGTVIRVEDGDLRAPDVTVSGRLAHVVQLTITPMRLGLPDPRDSRGRAALMRVASRRVRINGDFALARKLLEMLAVAAPEAATRRASRSRQGRRGETAAWINVT